MSKTGQYIYDDKTGKVVKISDVPSPSLTRGLNGQITGEGFDKALRRYFPSKRAKAEFMRQNNIVMEGSDENVKHRTNREVEFINAERKKKGLPEKTMNELVGNSRR
jgi:hypothetical protein